MTKRTSAFNQQSSVEKCNKLIMRYDDLKNERRKWLDVWREVSNFVDPFEGSYVSHNKVNREIDQSYILDNSATQALNTLVAGLASGATSPARQWFKIVPKSVKKNGEVPDNVKRWCADVERTLIKTFHSSNTYNSLHSLYTQLCLFGVGADIISPDANNVLNHTVLNAGEFCIQSDSKGVVNTLYRDFELTAAQLIEMFGYENVNKATKIAYDNGKVEERFLICHAIEPRYIRDVQSIENTDMPYASYYFYLDSRGDESNKVILSEGGYNVFPALCPRWNVITGNNYGKSPAIVALPNIKQLQAETKIKLETLELVTNPPLIAPASARQDPISTMPGAINFANGIDQTIQPIISSTGDINAIMQDIALLQRQIQSDFHADLFLLIQSAQDDRKTATEIQALKEEKMLVLGPVIERLQHELLEPLISITIGHLQAANMLPPPPQDINEMDEQTGETKAKVEFDLEFSSMLAQSQRAVDINSLDRMMAAVQAMAGVKPEILDNIDGDGLFNAYADRLSVDPSVCLAKDKVEEIRQQRAEAQAQAQQLENAQQGAAMVSDLSAAQMNSAQASMATQSLDSVGGMGAL